MRNFVFRLTSRFFRLHVHDQAAARFSRRHRFRRLRLRLDGTEAQRVLHPELHQSLRTAGRQQVRPRGGRVRESVFEEPRHESLSRRWSSSSIGSDAGPRSRPAASTSPNPEGLIEWMARETKLGNPALEKAVAATGDPDLKLALAWSHRREQIDRRHGPRRAAIPLRSRVPRAVRRARPTMLVCSHTPERRARGRVGRARHRQLRRARSAARKSAPRKRSLAERQAVPGQPHADDRRRPRRLQSRRRQRLPVLPDQPRVTKKRVGSGSSTKASTASSTAPSPATTSSNCSTNSTRFLPEHPPWPVTTK